MSTHDRTSKPGFPENGRRSTAGAASAMNESEQDFMMSESSRDATVSRRDVLKATWTVPVIMAVALPSEVLAGSAGDPGDPEPPPDPYTGSIDVTATGVGCDGGDAVFVIENTSGDNAPKIVGTWEAFEMIKNKRDPDGKSYSGEFSLAPYESQEIRIAWEGKKIRLIAEITINGKTAQDDVECP